MRIRSAWLGYSEALARSAAVASYLFVVGIAFEAKGQSLPEPPVGPTSYSQCDELARRWQAVAEAVAAEHERCLDVDKSGRSGADPCSRLACRGLHLQMDEYKRRQSGQVSWCRDAVTKALRARDERPPHNDPSGRATVPHRRPAQDSRNRSSPQRAMREGANALDGATRQGFEVRTEQRKNSKRILNEMADRDAERYGAAAHAKTDAAKQRLDDTLQGAAGTLAMNEPTGPGTGAAGYDFSAVSPGASEPIGSAPPPTPVAAPQDVVADAVAAAPEPAEPRTFLGERIDDPPPAGNDAWAGQSPIASDDLHEVAGTVLPAVLPEAAEAAGEAEVAMSPLTDFRFVLEVRVPADRAQGFRAIARSDSG